MAAFYILMFLPCHFHFIDKLEICFSVINIIDHFILISCISQIPTDEVWSMQAKEREENRMKQRYYSAGGLRACKALTPVFTAGSSFWCRGRVGIIRRNLMGKRLRQAGIIWREEQAFSGALCLRFFIEKPCGMQAYTSTACVIKSDRDLYSL